jgi:hypothetical protein
MCITYERWILKLGVDTKGNFLKISEDTTLEVFNFFTKNILKNFFFKYFLKF